jgi:RNA polymerase sigma-70 factor (ECF subfamily)
MSGSLRRWNAEGKKLLVKSAKSNTGVTFRIPQLRWCTSDRSGYENVGHARDWSNAKKRWGAKDVIVDRREEDIDLPYGIGRHHNYLFYCALRRLRNHEQAQDAVQDSFLAALHAAERFRGNSSQRTWLTGILKHKVYSQVRRACRERAVFEWRAASNREEFESEDRFSGSCLSDPSTELERKELGAAIEQALAKLPPRLARVFSLYEIEDWSGREVCAVLKISQNNLWITLHRARKQLRGHLAQWYQVTARHCR